MHSATPVTASVFAALTTLLSGCIAYDAAGTVVDTGVSVVSTTGDIVTSPFDGSDDDAKAKYSLKPVFALPDLAKGGDGACLLHP
jgi:hypothetical protein